MVFVQHFHKRFHKTFLRSPQSLSPRVSLIPDVNMLLSPCIFTARGLEIAKLMPCSAYPEVIWARPRVLLLL